MPLSPAVREMSSIAFAPTANNVPYNLRLFMEDATLVMEFWFLSFLAVFASQLSFLGNFADDGGESWNFLTETKREVSDLIMALKSAARIRLT